MEIVITIRIAILDDEEMELENTLGFLRRFASAHSLDVEYIAEKDPRLFLEHDLSSFDLALIDIIMPFEINGFDVAKKLRKANKKIAIMFLTKTLNYAINGYEVNAFDYLLKPLTFEAFSLKMTVFLKTLHATSEKEFAFKSKGAIVKVTEKEIIFIDSYEHYLNVHTAKKTYVTRGNVKDVMKQLGDLFSRCSNYAIVNFLYVDEIQKDNVLLKNGETLKITRKHKKGFLKDFSHYLMTHE